jgi:DNA primase
MKTYPLGSRKGSLDHYFRIKLNAIDNHRGWLQCTCPYCGREKKFGINLKSMSTNCFRCGAKPRPIELLMELEQINDYLEALHFLSDSRFDNEFYVDYEELPTYHAKDKDPYIPLPISFKNIKYGETFLAKKAREYVIGRGFSINELSQKGWGYCEKGEYRGYLIIPYHDNGRLIYFNARNFLGKEPRYLNPLKGRGFALKPYVIYNGDILRYESQVFVCEGVINAETMGKRAIALMGKSVSSYQSDQMIKSTATKFILLLDPDAVREAKSLAWKLMCNYKKVKLVILPDGKDVNDIGKVKTCKIVHETPWLKQKDLM